MAERSAAVERGLAAAALLRRRLEADKCRVDFKAFAKAAWPTIENGPLVWGWHLDAIAEHLQALAERKIRKLIVNISPRSSKSVLCSVMFPAWRWISTVESVIDGAPSGPEEKVMSVSFSSKLAIRDSRRCRNLVRSEWYQSRWSDVFKISKDQNEKGRFENDKGGYRLACSFEGGILGDGGSLIVLDDPDNLDNIDSSVMRQNTLDTYDGVIATRFIDPRTDIRLCIQQRGHQEDMSGHLMETGEWEVLSIPMEYDGGSKITSIGWKDPRHKIGELMHPSRFGERDIASLRMTLGPHRYAGQYQQQPAAAEGGQLKREYFNYWNPDTVAETDPRAQVVVVRSGGKTIAEKVPVVIPEAFEQVVQSWDMAFKDLATSDYVAGHVWGRLGANVYLLAREHGHHDFPATLKAVRRMSAEFPCPEKLIEDKANGPAVIQMLKNEIPGLIAVPPDGGKVSRVNAISGYAEAGNVYLPNPNLYPWVLELVEEFANFPASKHDDDTDAMTQAVRRLMDSVANAAIPEVRVVPRVGEPASASHVEYGMEMGLPPHWRRWVAVVPGSVVLWMAESPTGGIRVYREANLDGLDAHATGMLIAERSLPDVQRYLRGIHRAERWSMAVYMEKSAFAPVDPHGSYAELLESGIAAFQPTMGDYDTRVRTEEELKSARFTSEMVIVEDSSFDHLRNLLRFQPPEFEQVKYERSRAIELARNDPEGYQRYMMAVDGRPVGEWPKIRFDATCRETIKAMGSVRKDQSPLENAWILALMIGSSAPPTVRKPPVELLMTGSALMKSRRFTRMGAY